jgi:hypothetical protein
MRSSVRGRIFFDFDQPQHEPSSFPHTGPLGDLPDRQPAGHQLLNMPTCPAGGDERRDFAS